MMKHGPFIPDLIDDIEDIRKSLFYYPVVGRRLPIKLPAFLCCGPADRIGREAKRLLKYIRIIHLLTFVELTRFAGDTAFVSLARCRQRSRPVAYDLPRSRRFPRLVA
jgi:hypothetical protein